MMHEAEPRYDAEFLKTLFDQMQGSYERVSSITSFGFNLRWRRQLVRRLALEKGFRMGDLMTGGGETWRYLLPRIGAEGHLTAVDFSPRMAQEARRRSERLGANITVLEEDALHSSIPDGSLDAVVGVYGVKTLSPRQQAQFVTEIDRILKPGGQFGLVEITIPTFAPLRLPYLFHLSRVIPIAGWLLLGNPDNYRMLGRYVKAFRGFETLEAGFRAAGYSLTYHSFFFGCAGALAGRKP